MSLRIFHIVFIIVSIALSVWVAIWGIREYMASRSILGLSLAVLFLVGGALLVAYGVRASRKLKELP